LETKYGEGANMLIKVIKEVQNETDRVLLCDEQMNDESYTEDGIHLTNKALCNLRRKLFIVMLKQFIIYI
jgi:hypothetical protein